MLAIAGAVLVPCNLLEASSGDFWDKKDPAKWSSDEIDRLTTKSPWAKEVTAQWAPGSGEGGSGNGSPNGGNYPGGGGNPGGGGYPGGGMPRIGIGGIGFPRRGGRGGQPGGRGSNLSTYKGTVRWESAQPIRDALRTPLPDVFANHFVIGVIDFPLLSERRRQDQGEDSGASQQPQPDDKQVLDELKQFTSLQPKDKDRAQPGIVQRDASSANIFLFGFAKEFFDFGKNDHEVEFSTRLGRLVVKAKFDPRQMTYHKKLAL
jgi:hypothetical protein